MLRNGRGQQGSGYILILLSALLLGSYGVRLTVRDKVSHIESQEAERERVYDSVKARGKALETSAGETAEESKAEESAFSGVEFMSLIAYNSSVTPEANVKGKRNAGVTYREGENGEVVAEGETGASEESVSSEREDNTYIGVYVSGYLDNDLVTGLAYEVYYDGASIGTTNTNLRLTALKGDSKYDHSRVDLIEIKGTYDPSRLGFKAYTDKNETGVLGIVYNEVNDTKDYAIRSVGGERVLVVKEPSIKYADRIEAVNGGAAVESSAVAESSTAVESLSESSADTSAESSTIAEPVDELYILNYQYSFFGSDTALSALQGGAFTVRDKVSNAEFNGISDLQTKFSRYSDGSIDMLGVALNVKVLRSALNSFTADNGREAVSTNSIMSIKAGFNGLFSLHYAGVAGDFDLD
jgi:hypothetical protein|nr:MAG TPA: hypothetical protein [Caudoviricetes sp.]